MANVLKMAAVADIVTLIQAGSSDRRISALLSLDRGTVANYRRQLHSDESLKLPGESVHPEDQLGVTTENPPNAPTGPVVECSRLPSRAIKPGPPSNCEPYRFEISRKLEQGLTAQRIRQDLIEEPGSWTQMGNAGGHGCFASSSVTHERHTAKPSVGKRSRSSSRYFGD